MDQKTSGSPHHRISSSAPRPHARSIQLSRLTSAGHGLVCAGMAFLLGNCSLFFDAAPLGIAFLCASSRYTWYIVGGLSLSALSGTSLMPGWSIGVYTLAILLRLAWLFFVDFPPLSKDTTPATSRWGRLKGELWRYGQALRQAFVPSASVAAPEEGDLPPEPSRHHRLFREAPLFRMLAAGGCGLLQGLGYMVVGGFAFYDLLSTLSSLICAPLAVYLMIPFFKEDGQALFFTPAPWDQGLRDAVMSRRLSPRTVAAVVLLCEAVVYAANDYSLALGSPYLHIHLAPLLAFLLSLRTASRMGFIPGVIMALPLGLCVSPLLSPAYLLATMVFAVLSLLSVRLGTVGGAVAALGWYTMVGGTSALTHHFLTLLLAIPVFLVMDSLHEKFPARKNPLRTPKDFSEAASGRLRAMAHRERLASLSDALSSLSKLFYDMSDRLRHPRVTDIHRLCEDTVEAQCGGCERCAICGQDGMQELAARLTVQLRTEGMVTLSAFSEAQRAACPHLEHLIRCVNQGYGQLTEQRIKSEKTEVFADDYKAMADMLEDALREPDHEEDGNSDASARISADIHAYLCGLGYDVQGIAVCGSRERHITVRGAHMELASTRSDEIRTALGKICDARFSPPSFDVEDGMTVMRLASIPDLKVAFAGSTVPAYAAEGDVLPSPLTHDTPAEGYLPPYICGDHIALFTNHHAYFYALISDGMGSGEEASLTSDISAVFLKKLLEAGNRPETSIAMLGSFLRQKNVGAGSECSATVDLMELDLFCGDAVFFKNGAAPTYVVRNGEVYKLRSRSLPIGILKDTRPELLRFRTHPGDVVVMVSDGVTHGNDECPWLIDMLSDPLPQSMDALRADILHRAIASGSPDDLSAIALRVEEETSP